MKQVNFDKLTRHAVLACLLFGGASLPLATVADPTGIGDCQFQVDSMTGMEGWMGHPCTQHRPGPSIQDNSTPGVTKVKTPEGHFPSVDPFANPPGSNFLLTVYSNLYDFNGDEMPNTLPSTPTVPYNLHDGPVLTRDIDPTSPEDDLDSIIDFIEKKAAKGQQVNPNHGRIKKALKILEGDPVGRAYDGFPMLHYNGPKKVKKVVPFCEKRDDDGHHDEHDEYGKHGKHGKYGECKPGDKVIGGNVDVNMIYFNQRIESDTAFVDPSDVQEVPWTTTYHVKILNRGIEDFSPMVMNFDRVGPNRGPFHASMDQTYFPMLREGTEYTVKIKQTKGKYFNLTYTWGWRIHPPRVQVMENALKTAGPDSATLPEWEKIAFCEGGRFDNDCDPVNNKADRMYAISQIGDLSPAKRMWNTFKAMKSGGIGTEQAAVDLRAAFLDWVDRTKLPAGVVADPDSTITLFYVNNTIYGSRQGTQGAGSGLGPASYKGINNGSAHDWQTRPYNYRVTLLNGDHFVHGYMSVDFGGSRGWENQFQFTDPTTALNPGGIHTGPTVIQGDDGFGGPGTLIVDDRIVLTGEEHVFPINRGGTEEFLKPSPRNPDDPDNGVPQLGSGCFFTFGRNHAWPNAGGPWGGITVPPVQADGTPSRHAVEIEFNFEPSRRLRIYQFDPLHHDVAIYSLH
ncbi:MAG: hypothetical protein H6937_01630 [Burkholderiales bacterium]|nr:hypothetical protein [Burkholderiales bacterium]MDR4517854.1 hypothetical protein [Nitrosomonas sp.]